MALDIKGNAAENRFKTDKAGRSDITRSDYSDRIREQGTKAASEARNEAQMASTRVRPDAGKPAASAESNASNASQVGTQAKMEQAVHREAAANECVAAKDLARGLDKLMNQAPAQKADVATRDAPVATTNAQSAFVDTRDAGKQPQLAQNLQNAVVVPNQPARTADAGKSGQVAKHKAPQKGAEEKASAKDMQQDPAQAAKSGLVKQDAALAANVKVQGTDVAATRDVDADTGEDQDVDEGAPRDRNTSSFAVGSRTRSTQRELGSLLGGSAGEGNSESEAEGEKSYAIDLTRSSAVEATPIPESDPNFKVYSEFDSEKVGPETYAAKYQVLARYVLKKIDEISRFNQSLDEEIKVAFESTPLSKRIIGDIDIEVGKFTGSVYGEGMISG